MKYELHDLIRGRWILSYFFLNLVLTEGLFRFGGDTARVALSLMNVILLIAPLVTIIYGTMFVYSSREFMELLLCQPVSRNQLFTGLYLGFAGSLSLALVLGLSISVAFHSGLGHSWFYTIVLTGIALTWVFTGLAFWIGISFDQKVRGMGLAIVLWLVCAVIYDGLVLFILFIFREYPLEIPVLLLSILNPIDLGRIIIMLTIDLAAMMGYTGAVFNMVLGNSVGKIIGSLSLVIWILTPYFITKFTFGRKDF